MLRNYLAAAVRNLARNRLYAALNILGLGVGLGAALLVALYVRHELTFDRFLPGYEDIYRLSNELTSAGGASTTADDTKGPIAEALRLEFPQIHSVAEISRDRGGPANSLRRGDVESAEPALYWADPTIFEVLPLPAIAGDLRTALQTPDGLVLTRRMARKYFGTDMPIGQTIEVNRQYTMRVNAVLEDLPSSTHLDTEIFASVRALPRLGEGLVYRTFVYLRASPEGIRQIRQGFEAFQNRHATLTGKVSNGRRLVLVPISEIHLQPKARSLMKPTGDPRVLGALSLIALLIVLVAAFNYINLMTARAARRAVEVGVRKVAGATRADLTVQFIGESLIYSVIAMALACMLAELLLPVLNVFLDRSVSFDWRLSLVAALLGATLLIGILAGLYPAWVLSAFKPAAVLKGGFAQPAATGTLRQFFVLLQFGILIGLMLATVIVHQQTAYGLRAGLRFDHDQLLSIRVPLVDGYCTHSAFTDGVRALPGVRGTACASGFLNNFSTETYRAADGREVPLEGAYVGAGLFELIGLRPVAGRFFRADTEADLLPSNPRERRLDRAYRVVINETGARQLGYADPAAALGKVFVSLTNVRPGTRHEIIGVVPDFARDSVRVAIAPVFFSNTSGAYELNVRLDGQDIPATLAAIDRLWDQSAPFPGPIQRTFFDQYVEDLYRDLERQGTLLTVAASLAVVLAAFGLFGLAAFTVERRTREIGVRKALGANTSDVTRLLLWRFVKPVLVANVVAWPLLAWLMSRWLQGFAYHIDLPLWPFPVAAGVALTIAVIAVGGHSIAVARRVPVKALRHE
jgi:putative ABC transport system permease protein